MHETCGPGLMGQDAVGPCVFWFPPVAVPPGLVRRRRRTQLPVLTMVTGYARRAQRCSCPPPKVEGRFVAGSPGALLRWLRTWSFSSTIGWTKRHPAPHVETRPIASQPSAPLCSASGRPPHPASLPPSWQAGPWQWPASPHSAAPRWPRWKPRPATSGPVPGRRDHRVRPGRSGRRSGRTAGPGAATVAFVPGRRDLVPYSRRRLARRL